MPSNAPESPSAPDPSRRASAFLPLIANPVSTSVFGYTSGPRLTLYKGEFKGAFALCVVQGGQFLDSNFQRINPMAVTQVTNAYVRYSSVSGASDAITLDVTSKDDTGSLLDKAPGVVLTRLGKSSAFLSEPIELHPAWMGASGGSSLRASLTGGPPKVIVNRCDGNLGAAPPGAQTPLATQTTRSGCGYTFPLGLTMALSMYRARSFLDPNNPSPRYFICSPDASDCGTERVDDAQLIWSLQPTGVDLEGDGQLARMERETGASPPAGWYLRGIRTTTTIMPQQVVDGLLSNDFLTARATYFATGATDTKFVQVKRPTTLGTLADATLLGLTTFPSYQVNYEGTSVALKDLIIDMADRFGVPPQYLAAQAFKESSFNPYAFRYEPVSRDFRLLTGDTSETVGGGLRNLLDTGKANQNLGVNNGAGQIEYLPCEYAGGTPCISGQDPSPLESGNLIRSADGMTFQIPGLGTDKVKLDAYAGPVGAPSSPFTEIIPCPGVASLAAGEYCVDGDTGTISFNTPQAELEGQ